ncbi:MAG: hypothetical protein JWQ25_2198 [Daejeonella sp.]|nr:hypothetical protein [Daejeonella sp.]
MNNIIISDTSCLIALDKIGHLDILQNTFQNIFTTEEVQKEFGEPLPKWISIQKVINIEKVKELEKIVDKGEASAIALALETANSILIIDEKKGRNLARSHHIQIIGTLKIILLAKQKGVVPSIKPLINQLKDEGFRFSTELLDYILEQAGEF